MTPTKPGTITPHLVVLGVLGVVGIWVGGRIMERIMDKLGDTISQVAVATGTAIGQGVQVSYAPVEEPKHYGLADLEGEALDARAYDPTYDLLPDDPGDDRIVMIPPGGSIIPPVQ